MDRRSGPSLGGGGASDGGVGIAGGVEIGAIMYPGFATGAGMTEETDTECALDRGGDTGDALGVGPGADAPGVGVGVGTDAPGVGVGADAPGVGVGDGTGASAVEGDAGAGMPGRVYRKAEGSRV